jgi:hypothetical protein
MNQIRKEMPIDDEVAVERICKEEMHIQKKSIPKSVDTCRNKACPLCMAHQGELRALVAQFRMPQPTETVHHYTHGPM